MNKVWLKENWFKMGVLISVLFVISILSIYLIGKNNLEKQEQERAKLSLQQKLQEENFVSSCTTDAYAELKTLQDNFLKGALHYCSIGVSSMCDSKWWKDGQASAFESYQNEWVPQCKVGNRVFIHYEPFDSSK